MKADLHDKTVRTRFAPSPTGLLHSGNYRTAVFSYLFAKQHNGSFFLRIEDTDMARSKKEYEDVIIDVLRWLGLLWDKFSRQSDNKQRYTELLEKLISENSAYISQETSDNENNRKEVIRFRNPGGTISFTDSIRGEVSVDVSDLGDFVIAKSMHEPIFHFAVVVDDADAGITHIIRGEDHISNTPRQILLQRALGFPTPHYAHVPLILAPDKSKLSKRKGAKSITEYRDMGILPEALLNYLALLGWNPGDEREFFSREELMKVFSLERVQKSGAQFDETKLFSINKHWMKQLGVEEYLSYGQFNTSCAPERLRHIVPLLQDRAHTFSQARDLLEREFSFLYKENITLEHDTLIKKEPSEKKDATFIHLKEIAQKIKTLSDNSSPEKIRDLLMPYANEKGRAEVLWPLRYALSGEIHSPDPFTIISILKKEEALQRIASALVILTDANN